MQSVEDRVVEAFGDKELFGVASAFHSRFTRSLSEVLRHFFDERVFPDSSYDLSHLFGLMFDYSDYASDAQDELVRNRFYELSVVASDLQTASKVSVARTILQYSTIASYAVLLARKRKKNVFKELERTHFRGEVLRSSFPQDVGRREFVHDYLFLFIREAQMNACDPFLFDKSFQQTYDACGFCTGFALEA